MNKHEKYPKIVMVYVDWCKYCQRMKPIFKSLQRNFPTINFVMVNGEKPNRLSKYGIANVAKFPSYYFIKRDIEELEKLDKNTIKEILSGKI